MFFNILCAGLKNRLPLDDFDIWLAHLRNVALANRSIFGHAERATD